MGINFLFAILKFKELLKIEFSSDFISFCKISWFNNLKSFFHIFPQNHCLDRNDLISLIYNSFFPDIISETFFLIYIPALLQVSHFHFCHHSVNFQEIIFVLWMFHFICLCSSLMVAIFSHIFENIHAHFLLFRSSPTPVQPTLLFLLLSLVPISGDPWFLGLI